MTLRATLVDTHSSRTMLPPPPVAKPIRLGVVGLGSRAIHNVIGKTIAYEDYELAAVCEIREQVLESAIATIKKEHEIEVPGYTDLDQMLAACELDAVCITVDPDKQIPLACRAMEAGCHVMVEVPTAYTIEQCWQAVVTTERTGKVFMLMEQLRFAGYIRAWRRIVDTGVIGKPLFAEGEYFGYKPAAFFQDDAGRYYTPEQAKEMPGAQAAWRQSCPTIGYLPHEMSPMLYVLDDRVKRVVGMSNRPESYRLEGVMRADVQVALMHTEKDVVMRMAVGHSSATMPRPGGGSGSSHWHHVKGSEGIIESGRTHAEKPKLWVDGWQLQQPIELTCDMFPTDAPPEAEGSGHGGLDYFVFAQFADAVLRGVPPELDVYRSVETAAPAILAAQSIAEDNRTIDVPDFRPNAQRQSGEMPSGT